MSAIDEEVVRDVQARTKAMNLCGALYIDGFAQHVMCVLPAPCEKHGPDHVDAPMSAPAPAAPERAPLGWVVVARDSEGDETASCRIFATRADAEFEIADMIADDEFPADVALRPEPVGAAPQGGSREAELMEAVMRAIDEEAEMPGDMPDEVWTELQALRDRDTVADALRAVVRATKAGIRERAARALSTEGGPDDGQ